MEITRYNFHEQLDQIIADINESSFISIDGEFTGLDATNSGHASVFDTPEERYSKIRQECSDFLLVQFGLCAFKVDEEKRKYEAKPYNFYIFPSPLNRHAPDRRFLCQSSSIDFLVSQGFDFNKLFREGIPYLTPEQENKMRGELDRKHEEANKATSQASFSPEGGGSAKKGYVPIPEEQKSFIDNICEQITEYLDGSNSEPFSIPPCNGFQRKLIYQTVEEKFPLAHLETKTTEKKVRYMVLTKAQDEEQQHRLQVEKQNLEKMELDIQVGFTKVIRAITASGKLVVGHNMFLDVFHTLNTFHCRLPTDLEDFKTVTKSVLPRLLDTKLMANTRPLQESISFSSLGDMLKTLQCSPFVPAKVEIAKGFDRYANGEEALHEAGYDAFITGHCFVTMVNYLGTLQSPPADFTLPSSHIVEPFINKLFLMRINDIPYLNMDGPDLKVNRDHIFHVTFPKEWKLSDLHALFHPYGNVQISWLSETTAYVALYKKENATLALKALSQHVGSFHVTTYASHHIGKSARLSPGTSSPAPSPNKRKLSRDDLDSLPKKVKHHSLSDEPPSFETVEDASAVNNIKASITPTDNMEEEDVGEVVKDKLFAESDTWG